MKKPARKKDGENRATVGRSVAMKVDELMTRQVFTCRPDDTLATAACLMWEHDCGAVPVVADDGRVVGMVTDRDICMAAYTRGLPPAAMTVRSVMSTNLHVCMVGDSVEQAERLMKEHQIRRLPVLDGAGHLRGILSLNDLCLEACDPGGHHRIPAEEIAHVLSGISRHRHELVPAT